jgi:heme O synthase-like polyprenyltransferase
MSLVSEGADFRGPLDTAGIAEPSLASVGDYIALMKPRVMSLVVFTALVGLAVAPGSLHPLTGFTALLCIAVGAGAAGALNMWYDADIDAVMTRTARRPVPMGRVLPGEALAFGLTLAGFSVVTLGLLVNWLAAGSPSPSSSTSRCIPSGSSARPHRISSSGGPPALFRQ